MNDTGVLFVVSGLGMGGAERALARLVERLPARGVRCAVVSLSDEGVLGAQIARAGVPVFALGMRKGRLSLSGLIALWRIVRRQRPHVIQGWMYHGNLVAHIARLAYTRAKVVTAIRQGLPSLEFESNTTKCVIRFDAFLSRWAARVLYVSKSARPQHEAIGYCSHRVERIPNGFDTDAFRPDDGASAALRRLLMLSERDCVIGWLGRWHPQKDAENFLRAAAIVAAQAPSAHFVMVGKGLWPDNPALRELAQAKNLRGRLSLLGERNDVERLLPGLDLFVLSSASEGFPNVVGEAMSCAVPCVVTDVGDAAYIVGDTGWVVPARAAEPLAEAMVQAVASEPQALQQRGRQARARIVSEFSLAAVVQRYVKLYVSLSDTNIPVPKNG